MEFIKASDNIEEFEQLLKNAIQNEEDEYFYISTGEIYEDILNDKNYDGLFYVKNNDDITVISTFTMWDFNCLRIIGDFDTNIYKDIIKTFPDYLVEIDSYSSDEPFEFYNLANTKSSKFNLEYRLNYSNFLIPKTMDESILRDKYEKEYIPEFDINKVYFEDKTGREIYNDIVKEFTYSPFNGFQRDLDSNNYAVSGFHYFTLDESDLNQKILLCKQGNTILGAIKHGLYDNFGQMPHQAIAYIDVNKNYRNLGIATLMIQNLDKYLNKTLPLFLTQESELGHKCRMEEKFKKYIKETDCVSYDEQLEYCYKCKNKDELFKTYNKLKDEDNYR